MITNENDYTQSERPGHQPQLQFDRFGGMDGDERAFMLTPQQWRFLQNVRPLHGLNQVEPKQVLFSTTFSKASAILNVTTPDANYGRWVVLDDNAVWEIGDSISNKARAIAANTPGGGRFSTWANNNGVLFCNATNPVRFYRSGSVKSMYTHRKAWATPNGADFIGSGPFTKVNRWDNSLTPLGDLGSTFDWTLGSYYRIYVTAKINFFPPGTYISYSYEVWQKGPVPHERELRTLLGLVIECYDSYIIVKATNTVTAVDNLATYPVGQVIALSMPIPAGKYVASFYDHVVVGAPTWQGQTRKDSVIWSHLTDFADWDPRVGSEADGYTCVDYQRTDDLVQGITGIQPWKLHTMAGIRETLLVFTASCIYQMSYSGLPRIVHMVPIVRDYGCGLPYSSAALDTAVVWYDLAHQQFFAYRGQAPEAIGDGMHIYFSQDLSPDPDAMADTWTYVDRRNFEVVWVYKSRASMGTFDKAVAFNYHTNKWSVRTEEAIQAFGLVAGRALAAIDLDGTNATQLAPNGKLGRTNEVNEQLWVDATGRVLQTAVTGATVTQGDIVLETGDLLYGSAQRIKELSGFTINATATSGLTGIDVYVSARDSVDAVLNWIKVGTWTPTLETKLLNFHPKAAKVFRYKFVPVGTNIIGFVWSGFEDNIRLTDATR